MPADKISCEKLSGTARYFCEQDNGTVKDDSVEKMWSCVKEKDAGADEKARVGYYSDSFGRNQFVKAGSETTVQEKLNFAYADPKYYKCLNDNKFPIPFAMDDFDPRTSADAQEKKMVDDLVDGIVLGLDKEAEKFPKGSAEYQKELNKRIFTSSRAAHKFFKDCDIESPDYFALRYDCGMCSESSAVMYYQLKRAGLDPQFLFVHDIKPSMEWFTYLENARGAMDHVLVQIKPESEKALQVDLINNLLPANFNYAREISERMFTSAWLMNKGGSYFESGNFEKMEEELKNVLRISPDNVMPYIVLAMAYSMADKGDNAKFMLERLIRQIGEEHPWTPLLKKYVEAFTEGYEAGPNAKDKNTEMLDEMSKKDPYMAGLFGLMMGNFVVGNVAGAMTEKSKQMTPEEIAKFSSVIQSGVALLSKSFEADPNSMFTLRNLDGAVQMIGGKSVGMQLMNELLEKYPEHSPVRALFVQHTLDVLQQSDLEKLGALLQKVTEEAKKLVDGEPNHPYAHELMAGAHHLKDDFPNTIAELNTAEDLYNKRDELMSVDSYSLLVAMHAMSGNPDDAMGTVKRAVKAHGSSAVATIAQNLYQNINWAFDTGQNNVVVDGILEEMPVGEEIKKFQKGVYRLAKALSDDEDASAYTDLIFAEGSPFVALFDSAGVAGEWLEEIENTKSEKVQMTLANSLMRIGDEIASSPGALPIRNLKELEGYAKKAKGFLNDKAGEVVTGLRAGLIWQYLLHADRSRVEQMLSFMPEDISFPALLQIGRLFVVAGNGTKKNTERLYLTLQIIMDNKEKIRDKANGMIVELLDQFVMLAEKNGMDTEVAVARGWIQKCGK